MDRIQELKEKVFRGDLLEKQEIMELLKLSNQKYGQTLLVITHDESLALQADRIISIEDGKIARDEVIRR